MSVVQSVSCEKKARNSLTLEKKVEVIRLHDQHGESSRRLARRFGCGRSQIGNILKRKREWLEEYGNDAGSTLCKRHCKAKYGEINALTWEWFKTTSQMMAVSGPLLQEKALSFAEQLGVTEFKASNGWLDTFKKRHNVLFKKSFEKEPVKMHVDNVSVAERDFTEEFKEEEPNERLIERGTVVVSCSQELYPTTSIPYKGYLPENVFSVIKIGLLYRPSLQNTLSVQSCNGRQKLNKQITVMLCASAEGEKEKLLVIGKSVDSHCFGKLDIAALPVDYHCNEHAWMTSEIFASWLRSFDKKLSHQKRKVLLCLPDLPCHPRLQLENITFFPLPLNMFLEAHPFNQGVVKSVKSKFRKLQLQHILSNIEMNGRKNGFELLQETKLLDAIYWMHRAWNDVTSAVIRECFGTLGFTSETITSEGLTETSKVDDITNQLCRAILGWSIRQFLDIDSGLATCAEESEVHVGSTEYREVALNSDRIKAQGAADIDTEPTGCELDKARIVTVDEAKTCIKKLRDYMLQEGKSEFLDEIMDIQEALENEAVSRWRKTRQNIVFELFQN